MITRKDIEELGFNYYGESTYRQSSIGCDSYDKLQNIKAYSIKLTDNSYCHIHFYDNKDHVYINEIETTDMYGGANDPFAGYREGGTGPSMWGGLRIISKEYLIISLDILGIVGKDYDNRCLTND